jgi:cell wall-associated NlpC family hydrolase
MVKKTAAVKDSCPGIWLGKRSLFFRAVTLLPVLVVFAGCGGKRTLPYPSYPVTAKKELPRMGYTIQAGAFSRVENAARLTEQLRSRGLDATYFVAATGLYKVRFGNFPSGDAARETAASLKASGVIGEFFIISPGEYSVAKRQEYGTDYLREELVRKANDFIGVPYLWGGMDADRGFDCSGLAMTVYELNGLGLPRTAGEQYEAGTSVEREDLMKGDLVFFNISSGDKVTHVGIYTGDGQFIHAPGRGKKIRYDSLSGSYYLKRYAGARSYL